MTRPVRKCSTGGGGGGVEPTPSMISKTVSYTNFNFGRLLVPSMSEKKTGRVDDLCFAVFP